MIWNWLLLLVLLATVLVQLPRLIRLRSPQDTVVFCSLCLIAATVTIADMSGSSVIRPMDWVYGIVKLLSL